MGLGTRIPDKTQRLREGPGNRPARAATGGPSLFTSHRQGLGPGQQYFHAGPHRSTRHLSPATGRGSSLAEVFREAEKEERGQNPGEVAEASSEGERAKQAATPACPADTGQLHGKAV